MHMPNFLVVGVPKAGTTALHAALQQHPQLFLPPVKEPKYFLTDGPPPTRGGPGDAADLPRARLAARRTTRRCSPPRPPGTLPASPPPSTCTTGTRNAASGRPIPDARLIVMLRDPVERAPLQLDPPVVGRAGPDRRRGARLRRRRAGGSRPGGRTSGTTWHSAGTASSSPHLFTAVPPRAGAASSATGTWSTGRPRRWTGSARSSACEQGLLTEVAEGERHGAPDASPRHALLSRPGGCCPRAAGRAHRARCSSSEPRPRRPLTWEQRRQLIPYFADDVRLLQEVTGEDFGDWLQAQGALGRLVGGRGRPASGTSHVLKRTALIGSPVSSLDQRSSVRSSWAPSARVYS